ncbi:extracellular solute-binding protein [Rugosimonospora acidiphila]|uniref:Extracellular solute-binding protein n=1 Tax=Rugosimonospora acidiphila TaxID=556531 RepID=A0ABP9SST0_9ACTN
MRETMTRRRLLALAGGTAVAAGGASLLAACGGSAASSGSDNGASKVTLPQYIRSEAVKPDVAATDDGAMAVYYNYPRSLVSAVSGKPGEGAGDVNIFTNMFNPVPPGVGSNRYWQELNSRIGANLKVTMTPAGDYLNKLSTVIAGGDLPDSMLISASLANRSDILVRLCADLTEFVSGSAIKDYPSLANIPADAWASTIYGGTIRAIPIPRAVEGTIMFSRADLIRQRGLNPNPGSYQEFVDLAKGLTDAKSKRWAFGAVKGVIVFIGSMLGVPNSWREQGGKFTSEFETPERKRAVGLAADLAKQGLFHPDAMSNTLNVRDLFGNGTIAFDADGYAAWDLLANTYSVEVGGVPEPGFDGGQGVHRAGTTAFAITAFKKADKARVQQLLRICDWLATPLGTNEYMFRKYGIEGVHYTWQNGAPVLTKLGQTEVQLPLEYVIDAPDIIGPGPRDRVDTQRAYQSKVIPKVLANPTTGLYSETAVNKAGEIQKIIDSAELDIVSGRKPLDSWDDAVAQWRQAGGDQVRAEYEKALANRPR